MKISNNIIILLLLLVILPSSFALNIAVTPAAVDFGSVLREGYAQGRFKFSTYSNEPILIKLYTTTPDSPMNDWIFMHTVNGTRIQPGDILSVDINHPLQVLVTFEPTSDAPNGNYITTIGAMVEGNLDDKPANPGDTVARIQTGVSLRLSGTIDDLEVLSCLSVDLSLNNPEQG